MSLRDSELIIEPPVDGFRHDTDLIARFSARYTALPGRPIVLMDPPRRSYGCLVLPDDLQNTVRPESGTVISGGGVLSVGDRVIVRPYGGMWREEGGEQIRFYGVNDAWDEDILMRYDDGDWRPIPPWMQVRRVLRRDRGDLLLPEAASRQHRHTAVVVKSSSFARGSRLVLTSDDREFLRIRWEDEDLTLVREHATDAEGNKQPLVWAVCEFA